MRSAWATPFTAADLEDTPDDGRRYEVIDGALVVTPAPRPVHQTVSSRFWAQLDAACPPGLVVFQSPIELLLPDGSVVQPDLVVVAEEGVGEKRLTGPARLVVEVLSPGSVTNDLVTKRAAYARAGIGSYWIVDPDVPSVEVLRLRGDEYATEAVVRGEETWTSEVPFAVSVSPARLLARRPAAP